MIDHHDEFEIRPAEDMRRKYGLRAEAAPKIRLDKNHVPEALWPLIPFAELWGIEDDLIRSDFAEKAGPDARAQLCAAMSPFRDELNKWLAGPESSSSNPSDEYFAFCCMQMASDGV
jgi:hypothetical protein